MHHYQFKAVVAPANSQANFNLAHSFFKNFPDQVMLCHQRDGKSWQDLHCLPMARPLFASSSSYYGWRFKRWFERHAKDVCTHSVLKAPSGKLYLMCQLLARGTQSDVWLAVNEQQLFYAIKIEKQNDDELGQPNEAAILADRKILVEPKFKRDSVVKLADRERVEEHFFTIMPYFGEDLAHFLSSNTMTDVTDCLLLSAAIFAIYHRMHAGLESHEHHRSYVRLDPKPGNILVDDRMALRAIDMATAVSDREGKDKMPHGTRIYLPSAKHLDQHAFWKLDVLACLRIVFIPESFKAMNATYYRKDIRADYENALTDCQYMFQDIVNATELSATDSAKFNQMKSLFDVEDLTEDGNFLMRDGRICDFPSSILDFSIYLMLIAFDHDPFCFDGLAAQHPAKKAIIALAEQTIFVKPAWDLVVKYRDSRCRVILSLITIVARHYPPLLYSVQFERVIKQHQLPLFIILLNQKKSPNLVSFLSRLCSSSSFVNMLRDRETVLGVRPICLRIAEVSLLQDALVSLWQLGSIAFTPDNVTTLIQQAMKNNSHAVLHTIISSVIDSVPALPVDASFVPLVAALKTLRVAGLYKQSTAKKQYWFEQLSGHADRQVAVFVLSFFNKLSKEIYFQNMVTDPDPINAMCSLIKLHIQLNLRLHLRLDARPEVPLVTKAFIYFFHHRRNHDEEAVRSAWQQVVDCAKASPSSTTTLKPFIDLYSASRAEHDGAEVGDISQRYSDAPKSTVFGDYDEEKGVRLRATIDHI